MLDKYFEFIDNPEHFSDEEILDLIPKKRNHIINKHYEAIKRFFDVFFVLIFTPFVFPILAAIAIWIKLDSEGPVFYKQKRLGKDGNPFNMYKLRTMTVGADKLGLELGNDAPQVTKVGKIIRPFSLDELMQFVNILKGEMSFIGPRPQPVSYTDWIEQGITKVKPGIIALTMLKYREEFYPEKIFMFEKKYIENISIELDLFLFLTVLYKYRKILYWIVGGFSIFIAIISLLFILTKHYI
jgi:lipopolysaccharide/colanic/teichoic acid biosynthesis glycosyltransferase